MLITNTQKKQVVKISASLGGSVSCLADACLEERGVAWHPDPCALMLASYFGKSGSLDAPTPHQFDEFLLDDVYCDDPRAFLPSTLVALYSLAPPGGR